MKTVDATQWEQTEIEKLAGEIDSLLENGDGKLVEELLKRFQSDAHLAGELAGMTEAAEREPEFEFEAQFDTQSEINAYRQGFEAFRFSIIAARDAKVLAAKEGK